MKFIKKKLFSSILLTCLLIVVFVSVAQVPDEIITSLKRGDSKVLARYFNQNIELALQGNRNVCSKSQAQQIISKFFSKNTPVNFTVLSNEMKKDSENIIGTLNTENGNFRIYMLLKQNEGKNVIHLISIEKR